MGVSAQVLLITQTGVHCMNQVSKTNRLIIILSSFFFTLGMVISSSDQWAGPWPSGWREMHSKDHIQEGDGDGFGETGGNHCQNTVG